MYHLSQGPTKLWQFMVVPSFDARMYLFWVRDLKAHVPSTCCQAVKSWLLFGDERIQRRRPAGRAVRQYRPTRKAMYQSLRQRSQQLKQDWRLKTYVAAEYRSIGTGAKMGWLLSSLILAWLFSMSYVVPAPITLKARFLVGLSTGVGSSPGLSMGWARTIPKSRITARSRRFLVICLIIIQLQDKYLDLQYTFCEAYNNLMQQGISYHICYIGFFNAKLSSSFGLTQRFLAFS